MKTRSSLYLQLQELVAENQLLEKEVANYRKEMASDVKRFEDQLRSLIFDNQRLQELNNAFEDKISQFNKDKLENSLSLQNVKSQLKDVTSERDKIEREFKKEIQRLDHANTLLSEKNRSLTKDRIDFQSQISVLNVKVKDSEQLLKKYERDIAMKESKAEAVSTSIAASKVRENEMRKLQRTNQLLVSTNENLEKNIMAFADKEEALLKSIEDMESRMQDLEQENTILTMKVERLEVSRDYASQLEDELERLKLSNNEE